MEETIKTSADVTGEVNTQVAGPTTEPNQPSEPQTLSEEPKTPQASVDTVPYDKFAEARRELREYKQRLAMYETGQTQTVAPSTGESIPQDFITEDGEVDVNKYTKWIKSQIPDVSSITSNIVGELEKREQMKAMRAKEENEFSEKAPDIAGDPELREMAEALKNHYLLKGEYITLAEAGSLLKSKTSAKVAQARKALEETREIQSAATSAPKGANVDENAQKIQELMSVIQNSTDQNAKSQARKALLEYRLRNQK